jgi:hypothetical protein
VQWTVALGDRFDADAFRNAFDGFRRLYHVRPERVFCAPDVLMRFACVFSRSIDDAHSGHALRYDGIALEGAVLGRGTITFEGLVDEERMCDW